LPVVAGAWLGRGRVVAGLWLGRGRVVAGLWPGRGRGVARSSPAGSDVVLIGPSLRHRHFARKRARNRQNACGRPSATTLSCVSAKYQPERKKAPEPARTSMRFGHSGGSSRAFRRLARTLSHVVAIPDHPPRPRIQTTARRGRRGLSQWTASRPPRAQPVDSVVPSPGSALDEL